MPQKKDNLIVVLDIGSAWTRVLAADLNEGALRYRGHGSCRVGRHAQRAHRRTRSRHRQAVSAANEHAERVARAQH